MWLISVSPWSYVFVQPASDSANYQARRRVAMEKIPDGVIAPHSVSGLRRRDESGFHQDAKFYAFAGLTSALDAILVLVGKNRESWLFVMPRSPLSSASLASFDAPRVDLGAAAEAGRGIDHVVSWNTFVPSVESRLKSSAKLVVDLV